MADAAAGAYFGLLAVLMILETVLSRRNETHLRALGAAEPPDDVYRWMQAAYPGSFLVMALEGVALPVAGMPLAGVVVFVVAKALKYWAIGSLGRRWCFRVLVLPAAPRVVAGPYQWLRHPNYVAVALELVSCAVFVGAWRTGPVVVAVFAWLMWRRIAVEERALGLR